MTTINTFQDLKRILEENPDWLNELRQLILTEELLALPARFEEYARSSNERMDALAEMIAENGRLIAENSKQIVENGKLIAENGRLIAENSKQIAENSRQIAKNSNQIESINITLGWLKGESLENRLARTGYRKISNAIGRGRTRILSPESYTRVSQEFNDTILEATDAGDITELEYDRLLDTDAIIRTAFRDDSQSEYGYIVVEASFTANTDDLERVDRSANALGKIFPDASIHRALYCVDVSDRLREKAKRNGATVVVERNLGK